MKRSILIFPEFSFQTKTIIDTIRKKHDLLYGKIEPHITLVFPFESGLTKMEIDEIIAGSLAGVPPFTIQIDGLQKFPSGHLYLNISEGKETLIALSKKLYNHSAFSAFIPAFYDDFVPHITLAFFEDLNEMDAVFEELKNITVEDRVVIDMVEMEIIEENKNSFIESVFPLKKPQN